MPMLTELLKGMEPPQILMAIVSVLCMTWFLARFIIHKQPWSRRYKERVSSFVFIAIIVIPTLFGILSEHTISVYFVTAVSVYILMFVGLLTGAFAIEYMLALFKFIKRFLRSWYK
jgi:hypothetical protein